MMNVKRMNAKMHKRLILIRKYRQVDGNIVTMYAAIDFGKLLNDCNDGASKA